jgi:hypothetical protein
MVSVIERVFLWPGNLACDALGVGRTGSRELVRMLINSLVWTLIGVMFAAYSV